MTTTPWDPTAAASAASAFTTGLIFVVIAFTVERIVKYRDAKYALSVAIAPVSLVALLVTNYFFVLIAGLPAPGDAQEVKGLSAVLFTFAGSTLAMGAVMLFFVITAAVAEVKPDGGIALDSVRVVFFIGALVTTVFLVFGYDDIRSAVHGPDNDWIFWTGMPPF